MIKDNLERIYNELPSEVKLVAVSKFHPADAIREAYAAGQRVFAESRPQEMAAKVEELKEECPGIEWHFIGHLQTNKLKMVLPYASLVQSVDTHHLLDEIDKWAKANGKVIDVLLELHLGAEETKQGFHEEDILDLLFSVSASIDDNGKQGKYQGIRFRGLMGMASHTEDESVINADFERIDSFMAYLVDLFPELKDFNQLSIGMSGDYHLAVKNGSTMVRIGTAIFGDRN